MRCDPNTILGARANPVNSRADAVLDAHSEQTFVTSHNRVFGPFLIKPHHYRLVTYSTLKHLLNVEEYPLQYN